MPSFDAVSEVDMHEVTNAVDQAQRELTNRFDFKGVDAGFEQKENVINVHAEAEFQLGQVLDILEGKLVKRGIDVRCLDKSDPEVNLSQSRQVVTVKQGIETDVAKKIVKLIKSSKLKVQASIQGDQVRVTGKKRDDLQSAIAFLKDAELDVPLQFNNFRD